MTIECIAEMHLSTQDDRAIADLLKDCFETDFGGRSYFVHRHHTRLVRREGDRIVGHVALMMRAIRVGKEMVEIIGVGDVATAPDHRGQGIAGALLHAAIQEARGSLAQFMCLFGTAGLYAGAGFVPARNPLRYHTDDGSAVLQPVVSDALMVLPLQDLPWDPTAVVDLRGPKF